jgi:hypothetical protein
LVAALICAGRVGVGIGGDGEGEGVRSCLDMVAATLGTGVRGAAKKTARCAFLSCFCLRCWVTQEDKRGTVTSRGGTASLERVVGTH